MKKDNKLITFFLLATTGIVALWFIFQILQTRPHDENTRYFAKENDDGNVISFDLLDPQLAPPEIHDEVMHGFRLFIETQDLAKGYTGNSLTCANCHIAGGNTLGGENGGISLVGVIYTYPQFSQRDGKDITIKDRINNCFKRSLNGRPLPEKSKEMDALVAYLTYISIPVKDFEGDCHWLGLKPLSSTHKPDPKRGKALYLKYCAMCHKENGEGGLLVPPLWGDHSFNDGAGMGVPAKMASFIYSNMPYTDPVLTEEQALDIAAFVTKQPRPKFHPNK